VWYQQMKMYDIDWQYLKNNNDNDNNKKNVSMAVEKQKFCKSEKKNRLVNYHQ